MISLIGLCGTRIYSTRSSTFSCDFFLGKSSRKPHQFLACSPMIQPSNGCGLCSYSTSRTPKGSYPTSGHFPKNRRLWTNTKYRTNSRKMTVFPPKDQGFFGSSPKHPFWPWLAFWIDQPFGKNKGLPQSRPPKKCREANEPQVPCRKFWNSQNIIHFGIPEIKGIPRWRSVKKSTDQVGQSVGTQMFQGDFLQPMKGIRAFFLEKGWNWAPPNWQRFLLLGKKWPRILKPLVSRLACLVFSLNLRGG